MESIFHGVHNTLLKCAHGLCIVDGIIVGREDEDREGCFLVLGKQQCVRKIMSLGLKKFSHARVINSTFFPSCIDTHWHALIYLCQRLAEASYSLFTNIYIYIVSKISYKNFFIFCIIQWEDLGRDPT